MRRPLAMGAWLCCLAGYAVIPFHGWSSWGDWALGVVAGAAVMVAAR